MEVSSDADFLLVLTGLWAAPVRILPDLVPLMWVAEASPCLILELRLRDFLPVVPSEPS